MADAARTLASDRAQLRALQDDDAGLSRARAVLVRTAVAMSLLPISSHHARGLLVDRIAGVLPLLAADVAAPWYNLRIVAEDLVAARDGSAHALVAAETRLAQILAVHFLDLSDQALDKLRAHRGGA